MENLNGLKSLHVSVVFAAPSAAPKRDVSDHPYTGLHRTMVEKIVQGSGLNSALKAAARLDVGLPANVVVSLLRHEAPEIRAGGCRCTGPSSAAIPLLLELLDDPDHVVAREAACTLGRMGRNEARPTLLRLLQQAPSATVIDAISEIADEECLVILGRIARTRPDLLDTALETLDSIGSPPSTIRNPPSQTASGLSAGAPPLARVTLPSDLPGKEIDPPLGWPRSGCAWPHAFPRWRAKTAGVTRPFWHPWQRPWRRWQPPFLSNTSTMPFAVRAPPKNRSDRRHRIERQVFAQRHVFAERYKVKLVITGDDTGGCVDRENAVPESPTAVGLLGGASAGRAGQLRVRRYQRLPRSWRTGKDDAEQFVADSTLEGAVCCEPVSGVDSLVTGKNTGKSTRLAPPIADSRRKRPLG
jgi:hypothetical protein